MKILIAGLLIFSTLTSSYHSSADAILGEWLTGQKDSKVKIYKKNGKYYGKVSWLKNPENDKGQPIKDIKNKNTSLRTRPIIGIEILSNFDYKSGKWVNGKIYNPRDGETYNTKLELKGNNTLKVTAYWGIFSQTKTWTRSK